MTVNINWFRETLNIFWKKKLFDIPAIDHTKHKCLMFFSTVHNVLGFCLIIEWSVEPIFHRSDIELHEYLFQFSNTTSLIVLNSKLISQGIMSFFVISMQQKLF